MVGPYVAQVDQVLGVSEHFQIQSGRQVVGGPLGEMFK